MASTTDVACASFHSYRQVRWVNSACWVEFFPTIPSHTQNMLPIGSTLRGHYDDGKGGACETDHDEDGELWLAWSRPIGFVLDRSVSYSQQVASIDSCSFLEGRKMTTYSVAWRSEVERVARRHLLQHYHHGRRQEDIALATWYPANGSDRYTAIIDEVLLPAEDERILQGNVSNDARLSASLSSASHFEGCRYGRDAQSFRTWLAGHECR